MRISLPMTLLALLTVACSGCESEAEDAPSLDDVDLTELNDEDTSEQPELPCATYAAPRYDGRLPTEVNEASGIAVSRTHAGVAWLHNDSGDGAVVYAVELISGELLAEVTLEGVDAQDWEDIALAPCVETTDRDCLYVADIGDNNAARQRLQILEVPEPDPADGDATLTSWREMSFRYADEPRDAESFFVADGELYVLSKEWNQPGVSIVYRFAFEPTSGDEVRAVDPLQTHIYEGFAGAASFLATAADYRAEPRSLAVRAYGALIEYRGDGGESVEELLALEPTQLRSGAELQAEAVGYAPDGAIWHTSEGNQTPIYRLACD